MYGRYLSCSRDSSHFLGQQVRQQRWASRRKMEASVLDRIFEPYYTTKEQGKGTGLGLSVIHGIIKNHGGDITVKSMPQKGTTFQVYLPLVEDVEIGVELESTDGEIRGEERILLVDDEEQIVAMEQQMLENLGYQVTARTDSVEALKKL